MRSNQMTGMVFISGAGLKASIWEKVRARIHAPSIAIEAPGRGDKAANRYLSLDDYVEGARRQIELAPFKEFVLVCHSIGGVIGLRLLDSMGPQVRGFVALSASIPKSGDSYVSSMTFPLSAITGLMIRLLGTEPPKGVLETALCSGVDEGDTKDVVANFTPEAKSLYLSRINYRDRPLPRLYIQTLEDKAFSLRLQARMARNLGAADPARIAAGHLPMLSKVEDLVRILDQFYQAHFIAKA